ncbi:hypothetical protein CGLO_08993 [Colletotrichum gloeosporioides Cg-14]|uniref:Uncharacterized protein n=1 Tax=Colletotrichum gloeosporioides (strain Cg-14) TaxID=1237896 RepID=T0LIU4_COLGC|nr:hypothetical protein CGLO_08993 [Colletotrichum gloeosporioides Cg-14]
MDLTAIFRGCLEANTEFNPFKSVDTKYSASKLAVQFTVVILLLPSANLQ